MALESIWATADGGSADSVTADAKKTHNKKAKKTHGNGKRNRGEQGGTDNRETSTDTNPFEGRDLASRIGPLPSKSMEKSPKKKTTVADRSPKTNTVTDESLQKAPRRGKKITDQPEKSKLELLKEKIEEQKRILSQTARRKEQSKLLNDFLNGDDKFQWGDDDEAEEIAKNLDRIQLDLTKE